MAELNSWIRKLENALNGLKDYELIITDSINIVPKGTWGMYFEDTGCDIDFDTWANEKGIEVYIASGKARLIPYGEST